MDGKPPDATDNANYFCEYAYMYHQMDMLEDTVRTQAYHSAVSSNPKCFEGKVVLDVGAGTCILSLFAAKAGAAKVYAVEATDMAERGRRIVEANGLGEVITVLQGTVETVTLPCKVDVIISEWMGYFLLRESMLDSVLFARDKFLKPGGALYPSHASLYLAPLGINKVLSDKTALFEGERDHWESFNEGMKSWYGTDFTIVEPQFLQEQRKYYLQTNSFANLTPKQLAGSQASLMELDLAAVTIADLADQKEPLRCTMRIKRDGSLDGFAGFFDTPFKGSKDDPVKTEVLLSTAPSNNEERTHWGQQMFGFYPPLEAKANDELECTMYIRRQKRNHRLLELETVFELYAQAKEGQERTRKDRRCETYYVD